MKIKNIKTVRIYFGVLLLIALIFVIVNPPLISNDTNAYFGMWPYVSAGYPFFLRGLHFLFGDGYPDAVVGIQFVAILASIYIFVFHFLTQFQLKSYQLIIILTLLFYPIFDSNIYMITNLSTEGLSFALFLQIIFMSYLAFTQRKLKHYALLVLLMVILIPIRGQFQFLIPVFFCIEVLLWIKEKQFKWKHYLLFLMIPILTFTIDNLYHKVVQKQFFSTPFAWTTVVTSVYFVANDTDVQFLDTEEQQTIFTLVKNQFKKKGIDHNSHKYYEEPIDWNYFFYHYEFPTLCNQTVQQDIVDYYLKGKERNVKNAVAAYLKTEQMHKKIFFKLLPHVFKNWLALAFQNFKTGIGGISIALLYVISLFLLLRRYLKQKETIVLFVLFLILSIVINRVIVSVTIHGLTRYFFYTDWMPVFILFLGVNTLQSKAEVSKLNLNK